LESRAIFTFNKVNVSFVAASMSVGKLNVDVCGSVLMWSVGFALKNKLFLVLMRTSGFFSYADIFSSVFRSTWDSFFNEFLVKFLTTGLLALVLSTLRKLDLSLDMSLRCSSGLFFAVPVRRWEYAEGNRNSGVKVQIGDFRVRRV
jgi:hypothetical protein